MTNGIDTTPEIKYDLDKKAVEVTTYCSVNCLPASFSVRITEDGRYLESALDEHHGMLRDRPVSTQRLKTYRGIPVLEVLGIERAKVEQVLSERGITVRHIEPSRNQS